MNSELAKSLGALIEETLDELEDLKKSRFSASEVKLDGPGSDGIDGKPANGSLGKEEDKKDEDKKEEEKEMDKAEESDHKEEEKEEESSEKDDKKPMSKKEEDEKEEKEKKDKEEMEMKMKKSQEEATSLMKSFVDERIKPLEDKLSTIVDLVNKLADQPVAARGATSRAMPLMKSAEDSFETLSKSQVTSKLLELKKSGTPVDSLDVTKADLGQDLESIVKKYKIS